MSVKQYLRKTSEIQFVSTAGEIAQEVLAVTHKFPKDKRITLGQKLASLALDAYDEVLQGDDIFPRHANEEDVANRRAHFQTAKGKFASMEALLVVACDSVDSFKIEKLYSIGEMIDSEKNLLIRVMKADLKKLRSQKSENKTDNVENK